MFITITRRPDENDPRVSPLPEAVLQIDTDDHLPVRIISAETDVCIALAIAFAASLLKKVDFDIPAASDTEEE